MKLHHKVMAVEKVFRLLDKDLAAFKDASGLHCIAGCGLCCKKPDISASPLEFLPLAYYLFKQNLAYSFLEKIQDESQNSLCQLFKPVAGPNTKGFCSIYNYRGLICRLFGFSASLDKYGQPRLSTCQPIKTDPDNQYQQALATIEENPKILPVMRNYYFQLRNIDHELGSQLIPINQAIKKSLETVLSYYAYRKPRRA